MLGPPKVRDFDRPVLMSLESAVPHNHFYRHLERTLDLTFVRDLVADCYASGGRPSIDPVVFFKLHLIMFFENLRSERKLIEIASLNLAHRWYVGYNLDEPLPDHSSLSKIRARLGLPVFRRFFDAVVAQCAQAGLVWGKELIFDATKVRANASMDSLTPVLRLVVDDYLAALMQAESPEEAPRWDVLEQCRLDPDRPPTSYYKRKSDQRTSSTDPDAALMKPRGGQACLGYQDHYVVDGGKARIILHALETPGDVMENQPMLDLLRRVMFRWRLRPKRVIADTTYGTIENIRAVEGEEDIRAYVPLPDWEHKTAYFDPTSSLTMRTKTFISVHREHCCTRLARNGKQRRPNIGPTRRFVMCARARRPARRAIRAASASLVPRGVSRASTRLPCNGGIPKGDTQAEGMD